MLRDNHPRWIEGMKAKGYPIPEKKPEGISWQRKILLVLIAVAVLGLILAAVISDWPVR